MKKMRKVVSLALILMLSLSGCGSTQAPAPATQAPATQAAAAGEAKEEPSSEAVTTAAPAKAEEFTVVYLYGAIYPFMVRVLNSMVPYAKEKGINLIVQDIEGYDASIESNLIENYIVQDVDMIVAFFVDPDANAPAADACKEAGIPIVTLCNNVYGGDPIYVGSDDVLSGKLQADWLNEKFPEGADLLYMTSIETSNTCINRSKGLFDNINDNFNIVAQQSTNNRKDLGIDVMETWLQAYSDEDFDILVTQADQSSLGAIESLKAAGRMNEDLTIVSVDGDKEGLDAVIADEITMTTFQNAEEIGRQAIDVCVRIRDGEPRESIKDIYVDWIITTKDNVEEVYKYAYSE